MKTLPYFWLQHEPHPSVFRMLEGVAEIVGPLVRPESGNALINIERADAVLAGADFPADRSTFAKAKSLKVVARLGIGLDSVDLEAATEHGICVVHTPDAPTISVAEHTIGLILATYRKLLTLDRVVRRSGGLSGELIGTDLCGKTVGLVGLGRIGCRVAKLLSAFEAKVLYYDPFVGPELAAETRALSVDSLEHLVRQSDVLSLHLPLTSATKGLIGTEAFSQMKKSAILINVSRGPIVSESALVEALEQGRIAGAGLDVLENEPPSPDHPLLKMENVILSPHAAGYTEEGRGRSNPSAARQALQVLRGERPPFLANPEVWERRRRSTC